MVRGRALLPVVLLLAFPSAAFPAARRVAAFDDPAGDAKGPGSYVLPASGEFQEGDFDLRRFTVSVDGDDVLIEVTLGAPIRPPEVAIREGSTPLPLDAGIFLQNVDVYVDTDSASRDGSAACIPGRRVAFADGRTWKAAVVLTPQPAAARAVTAEALGPAAARVIFPERVATRGRTIVARVPASALGGAPRPEWGWAVMVSGARWDRSYALQARLAGRGEPDAFTLPVLAVPERWAFGGAPAGDVHPRVLDVLLPAGVDQKAVLGSFDAAARTFARVPFVYGVPPPELAPVATATVAGPAAALAVADVADDLVTVSGPPAGVRPLQILRVVASDGSTVARLVVERVIDAGIVARAVEGKERIARGAVVVFDAATPSRSPP